MNFRKCMVMTGALMIVVVHQTWAQGTQQGQQAARAQASADAQFLDQMIKHHQDGLEMMKMAEQKASTQAVKKMTKKMEKDQQKEISQMQKWRKDLFPNEPKGQAQGKKTDTSALQQADGHVFDQKYLQMMSEHHQGAIKMVNDYDDQLKNKNIRSFAEKIEKNQSNEVKQMAQLQSEIEKE